MLMKKLPIEIIQDIIYYLSKKDLVACQIICKEWYKKLIPIIYSSIKINGAKQFETFFNQTLNQSDVTIGYQIRELIIENGKIKPIILGQLPLLCPFLKTFIFDGTILSEESRKEVIHYYQEKKHKQELDEIKENFIHWKYLNKIIQYNGIHLAHTLLDLNSNLTFISIQFINLNDKTNSKSRFIKSLKNTTLLKYLSISGIYITINELEEIHENTLKLYSLSIINSIFLPDNNKELKGDFQSIQKCLSSIQFINGDFGNNLFQWLEYISIKYIHIKLLDLKIISEDQLYQNQLLQIAKRFTRLEILRLLPISLSQLFFNILDSKGICLNELSTSDENNTFIKSNQINSIKSLQLYEWKNNSIIMNTINQCKNLTTLSLQMDNKLKENILYFDQILKQCPKLEILIISNTKLLTTSIKQELFILKSLKLENVELYNIFDIIRFNCPLFNQLSITTTKIKKSNIFLPKHELKLLELDRVRISKKCSIRIGTSRFKISTSEIIWYDLTRFEYYLSDHGETRKIRANQVKIQYEKDSNLDQSDHLSLQCKNIDSIYLTGLKVV